MPPKSCRTLADVHDDVEDFPGGDADELALRMLNLVVQSAQHIARRARVVVLNEVGIHADIFHEPASIKALVEKAALIAKYFWFNDQDAGKFGLDQVH